MLRNNKVVKGIAAAVIMVGAVALTKPNNAGNCTGIECDNPSPKMVAPFADGDRNSSVDSKDGDRELRTKLDRTEDLGSTSEAWNFSTDHALVATPVVSKNEIVSETSGDTLETASPGFHSLGFHSPRLNLILPRGIQRGKKHTLRFIGRNLDDAAELIFYSEGFSFSNIKKVNKNQFTAEVTVDHKVNPGRHLIQVRTTTGMSDFRPVWINILPTVKEKESNSEFSTPQKIPLNVTVDGVCTREDADYFQVDCKKGQRLSVEVTAMRLGSFLFDPFVSILNEKRFEIAACDDSAFAAQDGVCSVTIPEDGKYTILVRESSFAGNPNCRYQLHVGTFPRPTVLFPAGGPVGKTTEVRLLGDPSGESVSKVVAPAEVKDSYLFFPEDKGGMSPSGNPFILSPYPNQFEKEPNHYFQKATVIKFPAAVNGILDKPLDDDFYKFSAKKGQVWDIEVFAKRIGSPVDTVLHLFDGNKKYLTGNDDSRGHDSYLRYQIPKDGDYYFRVRDQLRRGGSDFVYRVEFRPSKPKLTVSIPRTERYGQFRQTIFVPKGGRFGTVLMANRRNFSGPLVLNPKAVPDGITVHSEEMPANMTRMPVVFSASADAKLGSLLIPFSVQHKDPKKKISGHFQNQADLVIGVPNNAVYQNAVVDRVPVSVVESIPFEIEITQPKSPIVRGGTKNVVVVLKRKKGFKGAVRVEFPFRPPGIGTRGSIVIPAGKDTGYYPLNAGGNAQISTWPIYTIASANIKGGQAFSSSQLAKLTVATPYVTGSMSRASVEQGKELLLSCKINQAVAFEGKATAKLFGLPHGTSAKPILFDKTAKEVIFKIETKEDARIGKHRGVFCQLIVPVNGESVVSRTPATEVQVFKKPKPVVAKTKKPAPKVAAPKKKPATKPLSRLQKLRLKRKERSPNK